MSSIVTFDTYSAVSFDIDQAIESQLKERQIVLKTIEDKTCPLYLNGFCTKQSQCQGRHSKGVDGEVCKHWIRGLCKKGDDCEYLHIYDISKMPVCQFFADTGECSKGEECKFLHLQAGAKVTICPWYKRGFCRNGADCKNTHKRAELCPRYLTGFCPDGPDCALAHPKFDLMVNEDAAMDAMALEHPEDLQHNAQGKVVICHKCRQPGHYANVCPKPGYNKHKGQQHQQH